MKEQLKNEPAFLSRIVKLRSRAAETDDHAELAKLHEKIADCCSLQLKVHEPAVEHYLLALVSHPCDIKMLDWFLA